MHRRTSPCPRARWIYPAALLAACCAIMPGCIAWEIRDEMRTANYRISSLQTELEELQRTNQRLELVRTQLLILERIQISLANLDEHLAAVRVVISSMSSMMSLFDFSEEEPTGLEGDAATEPDASGNAPTGEAVEPGAESRRTAPRIRRKAPPATNPSDAPPQTAPQSTPEASPAAPTKEPENDPGRR